MTPGGMYRLQGSFITQPLDSNIETCSWHRVQVMGTGPAGASLTIESSTSDNRVGRIYVLCSVPGFGGGVIISIV